jgi:hypothetical protein
MKSAKPLIFTVAFFIILIGLIIYRYELQLDQARKETHFESVPGGAPHDQKYTADEIIDLIKKSKEYLGDTVTIFDNGEMKTSNSRLQGTIAAVIGSKDNMDMVKSSMSANKLPIQYNIYVLAATYYRGQYNESH